MTFDQVALISHADWSKNPDKRWMATAVVQATQGWKSCELLNIDEPSKVFLHLKSRMLFPGCILSGFDFPIGVPSSYAFKAGITDFLATLLLFGHNEWNQFYNPAEYASEITIHRPFYPYRPGSSMRAHLDQALGISFDRLYRLCEVGHDNRRPASPLFWTLGGQQVGKAAISGWRDLLTPGLSNHQLNLNIWPFSGSLTALCRPGNIVVVETYPAEFYGHLGLSFSSNARRSKRRQ